MPTEVLTSGNMTNMLAKDFDNMMNQLSDKQVDNIAEALHDNIKGTDLEDLANMPSNTNETLDRVGEIEPGYDKTMLVGVNPVTGEHQTLGAVGESALEKQESFDDFVDRLSKGNFAVEEKPITESEALEILVNSKDTNLLASLCKETNLSEDTIRGILNLVNRKMKGEEFNVYKSLPEELKNLIDTQLSRGEVPINTLEGRQFRNAFCDDLIDDFVNSISLNRIESEYNKEIEEMFNKANTELTETVIGYTEERNRAYREYANKIDDEEKKEKIIAILDSIDDAYDLVAMKDFSLKCKIKSIDLDKPDRVYEAFMDKYRNESYNIYDIYKALPMLKRNINNDPDDKYSDKDIHAFFICFCKQCMNMKPEVPTEHAYMYYTIYNIILLDLNKGNRKQVSDTFLINIKEVINNLRMRNKHLR